MPQAPNESRVLFLDVGHGSSIVICLPEPGEAVLVDSADGPTTLRALRKQNIQRLRLALATHSDNDHIAGMAIVLRNFQGIVDRFLYHPDKRRVNDAQEAYEQMIRAIELRQPRIKTGPAVNTFPLEEVHSYCKILYPAWEDVNRNLKRGGSPNKASAVLLYEINGVRFLLGGDLEAEGWSHLRDASNLPKAEVFLVPHHGGEFRARTYVPLNTTIGKKRPCITQAELLRAVTPRIAVISSGTATNKNYPPKKSVLSDMADYRAANTNFRMCCTQLTTRCSPNPVAHRDRAMRALGPRAQDGISHIRTKDCPCAGTVIIRITAEGRLTALPETSDHMGFLKDLEHPRCIAAVTFPAT